ncbi:MAG TPA: hypothetical protein PLZ77_08505 [Lachnospiraceae bacterium]|nr:hypothetical protein [Lachnospiraceae bacterium]
MNIAIKGDIWQSPWLILISMGTGIYLFNKYLPFYGINSMNDIIEGISQVETKIDMIYCYGGIALLVLPLLILLIRTRLNFIPVVLIKMVCFFLDPFYLVHLSFKKDNFAAGTPVSKVEYWDRKHNYQAAGQGGCVDGESSYANDSVQEKYQDPYRASQDSDYYHTTSAGSGEHYYTGDYVPYMSEGEITEVRTYDSDYAPMD